MPDRLFWMGGAIALVAGLAIAQGDRLARALSAEAAVTPLLDGCTDVPEAVALAETLRLRGIAVERALADLERRKRELAATEAQITTRLAALKKAKAALGETREDRNEGRTEGIERLIAVYDAMKPAEAATIIAALPPDFAAEILTRVQPDAGARIIARIDPGHAAILTAHMGARRLIGD
jgi:flagellar motility protein MotE (MotC chaperone)